MTNRLSGVHQADWRYCVETRLMVFFRGYMRLSVSNPRVELQAWLVLSRVAALPTVWSNCLAAWVLSGGGPATRMIGLTLGASLLYIGAAWLNDYFDVEFDRQRRVTRPLVSGRIAHDAVGKLGALWLVLGTVVLVVNGAGLVPVFLVLTLAVLYDRFHNVTKLSPVLPGLCRLFLYVAVASATSKGVSGFLLWCGIALGAYVGATGHIAQNGVSGDLIRRWPLLLLGVPVILAMIANRGEYQQPAIWLSFVLALWVLPCLRHALRGESSNRKLTVSGLTAGIVLVDLLATGGESPAMIVVFGLLFVLCLALQRYVPGA